ncbi:MAG: RNA polymerase sigma-70 factor [Bacteroidales bacterium]|nr:RNA polymerase sigma-70 factor [Bacteroidales bacterium]
MLNDLLILTKIKEGDIKTFEEVFRLYYAPLCLYASCIVSGKDAAEEIVQELFYVLWRDKEKLQLIYSLKNYLYGAVRKESLQYLEHEEIKRRYRETIVLKEENYKEVSRSAEHELEFEELQELITDTLKELPLRRSTIFKMHRFEGKKYETIASSLGLSVKTVEAEMSKALKTLKNKVVFYFKE